MPKASSYPDLDSVVLDFLLFDDFFSFFSFLLAFSLESFTGVPNKSTSPFSLLSDFVFFFLWPDDFSLCSLFDFSFVLILVCVLVFFDLDLLSELSFDSLLFEVFREASLTTLL